MGFGLGSVAAGLGLSSAFNILEGGVNAAMNYDVQRRLQNDAQAFNENMYKHRYQWATDDLKAAGLNPVLASLNTAQPTVSSGIGSASGRAVGGSAKIISELLSDERHKASEIADAQKKVLDSQVALNEANSAEAIARKEKAVADAEKTRKETSQIPSLSQWEVDNLYKGEDAPWYEYHARRIIGMVAGIADLQNRDANALADKLAREAVEKQFSLDGANANDSFEARERAVEILSEKIRAKMRDKAVGENKKKNPNTKEGVKHPTGRSILY